MFTNSVNISNHQQLIHYYMNYRIRIKKLLFKSFYIQNNKHILDVNQTVPPFHFTSLHNLLVSRRNQNLNDK